MSWENILKEEANKVDVSGIYQKEQAELLEELKEATDLLMNYEKELREAGSKELDEPDERRGGFFDYSVNFTINEHIDRIKEIYKKMIESYKRLRDYDLNRKDKERLQ